MVHYKATRQRATKWFCKAIQAESGPCQELHWKSQFDYFVEQSEKYQQAPDDSAKTKLKEETYDVFVAWHFMQAADYKKYGSLLTNLATQY